MKKALYTLLLACCSLPMFAQLNMSLLDQIDYPQDVSSLWGWTDPDNGTEYALVGTATGLSIVSLADPNNVVEVGFIPDNNSSWREVKSYDHYAYVVTESTTPAPSGVLVVDLSDAPNSFSATHWIPNIPGLGTLNKGHSITVDDVNGWLYINGTNLNSGGVIIADIHTDPANPIYVGHCPAVYCHDSFARGNLLYTSDIYDGQFTVYDVSDHANPVFLANQPTPGDFTHNTWLNDAGTVTYTTDEVGGAPVTSYEVSDLGNIVELDQFYPLGATEEFIAHNVHVWQDWVITAYYRNGCIILDGSHPTNLIEVGNFDTFVGSGNGVFNGVWGVYPYFASGLVIASDIDNGLFVFDVDYVRACWLEGTVTSSATGLPIPNADVEIQSTQPNATTSGIGGAYATGQATAGTFDVTFAASGFYPKTVQATLENGVLTLLDVQLDPVASFSLSGQTVKASNGSPVAGAQVVLQGDQGTFTAVSDANGNFTFPNIFGGDYTLFAGAWGYLHESVNNFMLNANTPQPLVITLSKGYQDDFILDLGWTETHTASSGWWVREEPVGTLQNGAASNTDFDIDGDLGDRCYLTGNGGGGAGNDDVDNGIVTLTSPLIDLSTYNQPVLHYNSWFFNGGGQGTPNDNFTVRVSNGTETVTLETITTSASAWNPEAEWNLLDYIAPSNNMHVIFETSDIQGSGHLVEAAVDAFLIEDVSAYPLFSVNSNEGCMPFSVQFTDQSDSTQTWDWTFEGGSPATSTLQNPSVSYNSAGIYDVNLVVTTDVGNTYTINRPNFITINMEPTAGFSSVVSGGSANFTNLSTGGGNYTWDFGDTGSSNMSNPAHTYQNVGTYTVTLTVENDCGISTFSQDVSIIAIPPVASFSSSATAGCAPFTVQFNDQSSGGPSAWAWTFPGGTPATSSAQNPSVVYSSAGIFSVQLSVSNGAGNSVVTQSQLIEVQAAPTANFTYTSNAGVITFINASQNATSYAWTFGDNGTGIQQNPTHTYAADGSYEVTLEVTNECGSAAFTQTIIVDLTGVNELETSGYSMSAQPNPFSETLVVNYEFLQGFETAELLIYNVLGEQLGSISLDAAQGTVSLGKEMQQPGVYFLRLVADGKTSEGLRVVKL